jgi:hypothetical protein
VLNHKQPRFGWKTTMPYTLGLQVSPMNYVQALRSEYCDMKNLLHGWCTLWDEISHTRNIHVPYLHIRWNESTGTTALSREDLSPAHWDHTITNYPQRRDRNLNL